MPEMQAPVRVRERGNQSVFISHIDVSLPVFLPPFPLSKNKYMKLKKKTKTNNAYLGMM